MRRLPIWMSLAIMLCWIPPAHSVPNEVVHVGVLSTDQGQVFHGRYRFRVRIFNQPVGGAELFDEMHPNVMVTDGFYAIPIGSINPLPASVFYNNAFVELSVDDGAPMLPRVALRKVPAAFLADEARSVEGPVNATQVSIQGREVINDRGQWVGDPTGLVGPEGPRGPAGPDGADGAVGAQGPQGPRGERGAVGPQGAVGPAGPRGEIGRVGPVGPVGPEGPRGPRGPAGGDGQAGSDADPADVVPLVVDQIRGNPNVLPYIRSDVNASKRGRLTLERDSALHFAPAAPEVRDAIEMGNNNLVGVNRMRFADPGRDEGLSWLGAQAKIYVAPMNNDNGDGYLRLMNDDGIALEPDIDANGVGEVLIPTGDLVVQSGQVRLGGRGGSDGVDLNNRNLLRANKITINDPGGTEGIHWRNTGAEIVVSPLDGANRDGYLRLVNDGGISLESNTTIGGRLDVANGIRVAEGNTELGAGRVSFGGADARIAIDLGNRDIVRINKMTFADPGPNEGLNWVGTQAKIVVSALNGANRDGYLRLINDEGISLESNTLVTGDLTINGTTTMQGDMNLQGGIAAPVGTFTTANITNATIGSLNGNTRATGTITMAGTLAVNGEVRLNENNRFVGRMNLGSLNASGDLSTQNHVNAGGRVNAHSLVATGGEVVSAGGVTAGTFVRAGNQGLYVGNRQIVDGNGRLLVRPAYTCPAGQIMAGTDNDGRPNCVNATCPAGQSFRGFTNNYTPICERDDTGLTALPPRTCPNGQALYAIGANGATQCRAVAQEQPARRCDDGSYVSGIAADGSLLCSVPEGGGGGGNNGPATWVSRGIELDLTRDPRNFQAQHDLNGNYWNDGGNDAFDNYGRIRFQHGGAWSEYFDITTGTRNYAAGGVTVRFQSDWAHQNVLRYRMTTAGNLDGNATFQITGNLGSDGSTTGAIRSVDLDGQPVRYFLTTDGAGGDPDVIHLFVPGNPENVAAINYTRAGDNVTITAPVDRLPVQMYIALTYTNDHDALVREILRDIVAQGGGGDDGGGDDGGGDDGGGDDGGGNGEPEWVSRGIELRLERDPRNFEARHDLNGNYWNDGGNDAFDNYGRIRFQHAGAWSAYFDITTGTRNYAAGGVSVQFQSDWAHQNVLRYRMTSRDRLNGNLTFQINGNLGSDGATTGNVRTVGFQGHDVRYFLTTDGGGNDPDIIHLFVPGNPENVRAINYTRSGDNVTITAPVDRLPAQMYIALTYSGDHDGLVRQILEDIAAGDGGGVGPPVIRNLQSQGQGIRLPPDPRNFTARQDVNGNYWSDGGNDAFDNYGRIRFQHGGAWSAYFDITTGRRNYAAGGLTVEYQSDWATQNVLRYRLTPQGPNRGDVTIAIDGNLGSDGSTQTRVGTVEHLGHRFRYFYTTDGRPSDPPVIHLLVPANPEDIARINYTAARDNVTITAPMSRLPATFYVALSYAADPDSVVRALLQDIVFR